MRRIAILLLFAALAAPAPVLAGGDGDGDEPADRRIVYVPSDKMDTLIEKHGRGVVLSVAEYLDLWRLAKEGRLEPRTGPARSAVVLSGRLSGTVDDESARLIAEYDVRVLTDKIVRVAFPVSGIGIEVAEADGRPALLSRDKHGSYLLLQGEGMHRVTLRFTRKVALAEEVRSFSFGLPTGAGLAVDLALPAGVELTEAFAKGTWRTVAEDDGVRLVGHLSPRPEFALAYRPRREEGERSPLIHSRGNLTCRIGPRLLTATSTLEVWIGRKPVREIEIQVPAGDLVTDLAAPELSGWSADEDGRVRLVFKKDVMGVIPVALKLDRALPGPGDVVLPRVRVPAAADERGFVGFSFMPGIQGRVIDATEVAREAIRAPAGQQGAQGRNQRAAEPAPPVPAPTALYRYWSKDRSLTVKTEVPEGRLEAEAAVTLSLYETVRELRADLAYKADGRRIYRLAPFFPPEYELVSAVVEAPVPHVVDRLPDGTLVVDFPSGVAIGALVRVKVQLVATQEEWRAEDFVSAVLPLPLPRAGTDAEVRGRLIVFADEEFTVEDSELVDLRSESVERLGLPGARLGYRWRADTARGELAVTRRTPKVSVRHVAAVAPGDKTARYTGFLHYTIRRAGIRRFSFTVAGDLGDRLHVSVPGNTEPVRTRTANGEDLWVVTLPQKVRGEVVFGLWMDEDMTDGVKGREFSFPMIRVLDVQDQTGYLGVESGDNMEISVTPEGLREIGLDEMDPVIRALGHAPSRGLLAAYQYASLPYALTISAARYEERSVLTAFVDSASILSLVAEDGTVRSRATYLLLNAELQFLRVRLPENSVLWGAFVNGQPVKPAQGRGVALIPLETTSGAGAVPVVLMYETVGVELESSGGLALDAPVLEGVPGAKADWEVWLPSGYRVTAASGVFGAQIPPAGAPWFARLLDGLAGRFGGTNYSADSAVVSELILETTLPSNKQEAREPEMEGTAAGPARSQAPRPAPAPRAAMDPGDTPVEDPVIKDAKISDHNETDNDMPFEESAGEKDFISDAPFEGPSTNAAIGVGGGAGGRFGGRDGRRRAPPERLGRKGGLSLDVRMIPGGTSQRVSALGVEGGIVLDYLESESRTARGYVMSVVFAILAILVTGAWRRKPEDGFRIPAFAWVIGALAFLSLAPSWFGARDLTIWDGAARGTFWGGLILIAIALARRIRAFARPAAAAALLVLLAFSASAEAGPGRPAPKPADSETVYVPYDPERIGDTTGAERVFVPFAEFRRLWNAAHPDRKIEAPDEAPVPWLVTAAGYNGVVEGETVRIEARYDLVVLEDGWVKVALPLAPAVVEDARVDGEPVRVLSEKGAHVLVLEGRGARRVELVLRAVLGRDGDRRNVSIALPPIPGSSLTFTLPFKDAEVDLEAPMKPHVDGTTLTARLGPISKLALAFRPKTEEPELRSRVEVETREALSLREGLVQLRLRADWRVVTGSISRAEFSLDPDLELVGVEGKDVKTWDVLDGRLAVTFSRVVTDSTAVEVIAEIADGVRARRIGVPRITPLGAVRERGLLGIAASPGLRLTLADPVNLERVSSGDKTLSNLPRGDAVMHSVWRFVVRPLGLDIRCEPVKSEIRAVIPVQHLVEREWLRSRATFELEVRGDGAFEFPVTVPADLTVESVEGAGLDRWWRDGDLLILSAASPVRGKFTVHAGFRRRLAPDAVRVDLPEFHATGVTRERGWILVSHAPGLSLTLLDDQGLVKDDIGRYSIRNKIAPDQKKVYGYRQDGEPYSLAVARSFPEARVRPTTTTRLQVEDDRVVVDVNVAYAIENAGEDTFKVFVPEGEGEEPIVVAERTRRVGWEDVEIDGRRGRLLTVVLQQEAYGSYQLRIVYEKRLELSNGDVRSGTVTVKGVEPEGDNPTAFVFATNLSEGEAIFGKPDGLGDADPLTFPFLPDPASLPRHLILSGWQGRAAAWSLPIDLRIHSFADFPDALISSADLLSAVGRDGWTRNRITYSVLNRTRQLLEITMPEGAVLEAVRVGGEAVKPGRRRVRGKERVLVPLARMQVGDVSTEVTIFWSRALGPRVDLSQLSNVDILEPKVHGLEVEKTFFTIYMPEGYRYSFDGNMGEIVEADKQLYLARQALEEQKRVVQVQEKGSQSQQARADESGIANRAKVKEALQLLANVQLEQSDRDELRSLVTEWGALEQQFSDNFASRAGGRGGSEPSPGGGRTSGDRHAKTDGAEFQDELEMEDAEVTKKLAEEAARQEYRYKGKANVVSQDWNANDMPLDDDLARTRVQVDQQLGEEGRAWRNTFVGLVQVAPGQGRGGVHGATGTNDFPGGDINLVPSGGFGFGFDDDRSVTTYSTTTAHLPRTAPVTKAGLLSLPVSVPRMGRVFRFEKRNGGALLEISVGRAGASRTLTGIGWFLLVLALLGLFYRFRPDRKIPYFRPVLLFLVSLLLITSSLGPVALLGFSAAFIWAYVEFMERKTAKAA